MQCIKTLRACTVSLKDFFFVFVAFCLCHLKVEAFGMCYFFSKLCILHLAEQCDDLPAHTVILHSFSVSGVLGKQAVAARLKTTLGTLDSSFHEFELSVII